VRLYQRFELDPAVEQTLDHVLSPDSLDGECKYLAHSGHKSFERPYGLAWLLKLYGELQETEIPAVARWSENLLPLAELVEARFLDYLRVFDYPVRVGTHANSAFSMGLALEYATACDRTELKERIVYRARNYFLGDRSYPAWMEPCGGDFLSSALVEADLMSQVLQPAEFVSWFDAFLPAPEDLLKLPAVQDRTDPSGIHLDGLFLSKAWCLERIVRSLPAEHSKAPLFTEAAGTLADTGMNHAVSGSFLGDHWLPSFATYWDSVVNG